MRKQGATELLYAIKNKLPSTYFDPPLDGVRLEIYNDFMAFQEELEAKGIHPITGKLWDIDMSTATIEAIEDLLNEEDLRLDK